MNIEDQVCSLVVAKMLKEIGVAQESCFFYEWYSDEAHHVVDHYWLRDNKQEGAEYVSAFTCSELGKMLPYQIEADCGSGQPSYFYSSRQLDLWEVGYRRNDLRLFIGHLAAKEADARARLLIHLIKQGHMKNGQYS